MSNYGIYLVLKTRIAGGQYTISEITSKIDALWAENKLTDDQHAELIATAQTNADPNYSPMNETEKALDDRLLVVEGALIDMGALVAQLMTGGEVQ